MAIITVNKVWNATGYTLWAIEDDGDYEPIAENTICEFDTSTVEIADDVIAFCVTATGEAPFIESAYSNSIDISELSGGSYTFTIENDWSYGCVDLYINGIKQDSCEGTWENVTTVGLQTNDGETYWLGYSESPWDDYWAEATPDYQEITLTEDVYINYVAK